MPKMKSNSSIKKRFKVTGTGKLVHHKMNATHNLTKKNAKRKRRLRETAVLSAADRRRVERLLAR
ncbi:50S ribosomal protein L35 [Candidatus Sumerlaeota bacterium]|nr:50S ribosomal protein L35 [Candidatus Sumerlaeota bacterium]